MASFKDILLGYSGYYGFTIGIQNFDKRFPIYSHIKLIIEIISSMLIAYYYTYVFIAMLMFNAIYDLIAYKADLHFREKIWSSYYSKQNKGLRI